MKGFSEDPPPTETLLSSNTITGSVLRIGHSAKDDCPC